MQGVKQTGVGGQERVGMEAGGEGERRRGEGKFEMGEADWKIGAWKGKEDRRGAGGVVSGGARGRLSLARYAVHTDINPLTHTSTDAQHQHKHTQSKQNSNIQKGK